MTIDDLMLADYVSKSLVIVPIILGIVQALKSTKIPDSYAPIISIVIGVLIAFVIADNTVTWGHNVIGGLIYGLSASGLYSGTKAIYTNTVKKEEP